MIKVTYFFYVKDVLLTIGMAAFCEKLVFLFTCFFFWQETFETLEILKQNLNTYADVHNVWLINNNRSN